MQVKKHAGEEYEPTLSNQYYELISPIGVTEQTWDLADIMKAHRTDPFCKYMCEYLKSGVMPQGLMSQLVPVEADDDYDSSDDVEETECNGKDQQEAKRMAALVVTLAPHFTVSQAGLLLRLHQRNGNKHQQLAQELQLVQQLYIPTVANSDPDMWKRGAGYQMLDNLRSTGLSDIFRECHPTIRVVSRFPTTAQRALGHEPRRLDQMWATGELVATPTACAAIATTTPGLESGHRPIPTLTHPRIYLAQLSTGATVDKEQSEETDPSTGPAGDIQGYPRLR